MTGIGPVHAADTVAQLGEGIGKLDAHLDRFARRIRQRSLVPLLDRYAIIAEHLPAGARERVGERGLPTSALTGEEPGAPIGRHHAGGVQVEEPALAELEDRAESSQLAPRVCRCVAIAASGGEPSPTEAELRALLGVDQQRVIAGGDSVDRAVAPGGSRRCYGHFRGMSPLRLHPGSIRRSNCTPAGARPRKLCESRTSDSCGTSRGTLQARLMPAILCWIMTSCRTRWAAWREADGWDSEMGNS